VNNCPNNEIYQNALDKIERDSRLRPTCCSIIIPTNPTGPTGGIVGPTHTLLSESK